MFLKWLPMILPAVLAAVAALSDVVQPYVVANPTLALLLGAVAAVLGILLKSPLAPKP